MKNKGSGSKRGEYGPYYGPNYNQNYGPRYDGSLPPLRVKDDQEKRAFGSEYRAQNSRAKEEESRAARRIVAGSRDRDDRARD